MIDPSFSASFRALGAALFLTLGSGCSAMRNCAEEDSTLYPVEIVKSNGGFSDPVAITYQSSSEHQLHEFKAKKKYLFFHELGVTPLIVKVYLSFDPKGTGTKDDPSGSIAESAGNQALIDCKDEHVIEVRNDTCQDFFIQVVAAEAAVVPGAGGAGGADGADDASCGE